MVKKRVTVFVCFMVAMILTITGAVVISDGEMERKRELEQIRREVDGQIKANMERAVKEGNFSRYLDPAEVSFTIKEIYREDALRYAVKVVFTARTDRELSAVQMKEAAKDMEKLCKEFQTIRGKYVTVYSRGGKEGIVSVINGHAVKEKETLKSGSGPLNGVRVWRGKLFPSEDGGKYFRITGRYAGQTKPGGAETASDWEKEEGREDGQGRRITKKQVKIVRKKCIKAVFL